LKFRTAIIGLGRVGTQDDDDHQRPGAWTHAGAYQSLPEIELVAGADPDTTRLRRFVERRGVASVYRNYRDMLETEYIQLLSICAPTPLHYDMVMDGVRAGVRAIFCEKPLATSMEEAFQMVEACEQAGIVLAVNHTRRWEPIYQQAKRMITQGAVGDLETIVGYYPGKVFTLGTHLFDLLRFFAGDVEWVCGDTVGYQDGEWSFNGLLRFESGARGTVLCGKDSANHVFECDLIGSRGRLRLSGDGARMEFSRLDHSARYAGYREFGPASEEHAQPIGGGHRLIAAVKDLVGCAVRGGTPAGSGRDGMAALAIAWALCESAALGSVRVDVRRR
jgi:predicted dehydrogenase